MKSFITTVVLSLALFSPIACDGEKSPVVAAPTAKPAVDDHVGHDHGAPAAPVAHAAAPVAHAAAPVAHAAAPVAHAAAPVVDLGTISLGTVQAHVTRDAGAITAGGEAPIDATITGTATKISAVRFWIGTADGKGSVKAKADIEDPKKPNTWHTHVEVPNPIPAGSQVWIEIQLESNEKLALAFDLKS